MPRRDDIRDAVSDDARFAAARARQNQQRAFGAGDGFTLLRVQALEKIHVGGTLRILPCRRTASAMLSL